MRKSCSVLILILLMAMGCDSIDNPATTKVYYYNLDSLLLHQKAQLLENKAKVSKWAYVDGDTAISDYQPDSAQWADELAFFSKMNINKPVLQDVYSVIDTSDSQSNLQVRWFKPVNPKEVEVRYLKLYYLTDIHNLKKIEALNVEKNPIYSSARKLSIYFDDTSDKGIIQQYVVEGGQKMLLKDSVEFKIEATVK